MTHYDQLYRMLGDRQKRQFFLFVLASFLFATVEAISIGLLLPFFNILAGQDVGFVGSALSFFLGLLNIPSDQINIVYTAAVLLATSICLKAILHIWVTYLSADIPYEFFKELGHRLNRKFLSTPWEHFSRKNKSEMLKTITKSNELVAYAYVVAMMLVSNIAVMIIMMSLLMIVDFQVTALILLFFGIIGSVIYLFIRSQQIRAGIDRELGLTSIFGLASDNLNNLKQIQITQASNYFEQKFNNEMASLAKAFTKTNFYPRLPIILLEFFAIFALTVFASWAYVSQLDMLSLLGTLILYAAVGRRILPTAAGIIFCQATLKNMAESIGILYSEFNQHYSSDYTENNQQVLSNEDFRGTIALKDVFFAYPNGEDVLKGVSVEIKKGNSVAFVGLSGSGKTTLVDMICGLIKPKSGQLYIDNKPVNSFASLQGRIGYVEQSIALINGNIADNVVFGCGFQDDDLITSALKIAKLDAVCEALPHGVYTDIGDDGELLSGGERQRLAIARAVYNNKKILIFDEATSDLDNLTEEAIVAAMQELSDEKIIISIAHRLTAIKKYDQIHVVDAGQIIASGTHDELMQNSERYRNLASVYK